MKFLSGLVKAVAAPFKALNKYVIQPVWGRVSVLGDMVTSGAIGFRNGMLSGLLQASLMLMDVNPFIAIVVSLVFFLIITRFELRLLNTMRRGRLLPIVPGPMKTMTVPMTG